MSLQAQIEIARMELEFQRAFLPTRAQAWLNMTVLAIAPGGLLLLLALLVLG